MIGAKRPSRRERIAIEELGSREPVAYVYGACEHRNTVPVEVSALWAEIVAHLCLDCDAQLPEDWEPDVQSAFFKQMITRAYAHGITQAYGHRRGNASTGPR